MATDRKKFFALIRSSGVAGKPLKPKTVESIEAILDAWERIYPNAILEERAYTLATARHEAWNWKAKEIDYAIEEFGGRDRPYGQPHRVTGQRYYGRGLTQTTHIQNYERAGKHFHTDLVTAPELALRKDISAGILVVGSVLGWFRGKRLSHYFGNGKNDPVNARDIINGDVKKNGALVAGYYHKFLAALRAAETGRPLPPPVEPIPAPSPPAPTVVPPAPPPGGTSPVDVWVKVWNWLLGRQT